MLLNKAIVSGLIHFHYEHIFTIDSSNGFTVEQYQQSYTKAASTAQETRQSLLKIIARLRVEMASERLPLVAWRVHHQIQEIAENLRWGVLRG